MSNTFFDDEELLNMGLSQPMVDALKQAFDNSSGNQIADLTLEQVITVSLSALGITAEQTEAISYLARKFNNLVPPETHEEQFSRIDRKINQVLLQSLTTGELESRASALERRVSDLEALINGAYLPN